MNVALLGGSFNPPHVGHMMAALYVHAVREVDQVWLMPSFRHPFGKPLEAFEHRVRMCRAMAADLGPWLVVSEVEREVGGEGWTVETLEHLRAAHPEHHFTLVVGSDIVKDLPQWRSVERIRALADFLVLHRAGHPAPDAVGPPLARVSSSEIRAALEAGHAPDTLVPRAVLAYARDHRLYGLG